MEIVGKLIVNIVVWFLSSLLASWLAWWILGDVTPMPDWSFGEWFQVVLVVFSVLGIYQFYSEFSKEVNSG
jgi:hypothetical protein